MAHINADLQLSSEAMTNIRNNCLWWKELELSHSIMTESLMLEINKCNLKGLNLSFWFNNTTLKFDLGTPRL